MRSQLVARDRKQVSPQVFRDNWMALFRGTTTIYTCHWYSFCTLTHYAKQLALLRSTFYNHVQLVVLSGCPSGHLPKANGQIHALVS